MGKLDGKAAIATAQRIVKSLCGVVDFWSAHIRRFTERTLGVVFLREFQFYVWLWEFASPSFRCVCPTLTG